MSIRKTIAGAAGDVVAMVRTRLELFGLELNVETARLFSLLGLACASLLCATLSAVVFSLLIIAYFWDTPQRFVAIALLAVAYGLASACMLVVLCRRLRAAPRPFDATLEELKRDLQMLSLIGRVGPTHEHSPAPGADQDDPRSDALQSNDREARRRSQS